MKSQTISRDKALARIDSRGFTLIEIMLVISLIAITISFSFYFDFDNFRSHSFLEDRDTLISALQHARGESMANICRGDECGNGRAHGVAVRPADNPDSYVIFQTGTTGLDYASRDSDFDAILEANPNIIISGSISEVVFKKLEGSIDTPGDITLNDATGRTSTITINSEGQIIWTN